MDEPPVASYRVVRYHFQWRSPSHLLSRRSASLPLDNPPRHPLSRRSVSLPMEEPSFASYRVARIAYNGGPRPVASYSVNLYPFQCKTLNRLLMRRSVLLAMENSNGGPPSKLLTRCLVLLPMRAPQLSLIASFGMDSGGVTPRRLLSRRSVSLLVEDLPPPVASYRAAQCCQWGTTRHLLSCRSVSLPIDGYQSPLIASLVIASSGGSPVASCVACYRIQWKTPPSSLLTRCLVSLLMRAPSVAPYLVARYRFQ